MRSTLPVSSERDSIAVDRGRARDGFYIIRKGISAFLSAKTIRRMRRKSGLLFTALYLKQCGSSLQKAYAGDPSTGLLPFPVSLTRKGYPTIIPFFHRLMIYRKDEKADNSVQLYLSWFSLAKVIKSRQANNEGYL